MATVNGHVVLCTNPSTVLLNEPHTCMTSCPFNHVITSLNRGPMTLGHKTLIIGFNHIHNLMSRNHGLVSLGNKTMAFVG